MPKIPQPTSQPQSQEVQLDGILQGNFLGSYDACSRTEVPADKAWYLENLCPLGPGKLSTVPGLFDAGLSPIYTGDTYYAESVNLNGLEKIVFFDYDGSAFIYDVSTLTVGALAAKGTLSGTNSRCYSFQNQALLISDSTGYYYWLPAWQQGLPWPQSAIKKLTGTGVPTTCDAIGVYQSRVFLAAGPAIYVSGAGGYDDGTESGTNYWLPENGAAYHIITDPNVRGKITRMWAGAGVLYYFYGNGVNVISNVNTPLGLIPPTPNLEDDNIEAVTGTTHPGSICPRNMYPVYANSQGAYLMYGLYKQELHGDILGTFQYIDGTQPITAGQVMFAGILWSAFLITRKGNPYHPDGPVIAMYAKVAGKDRWWFMNVGAPTNQVPPIIVSAYVNNQPTLFLFINNYLYQCLSVTGNPALYSTLQTRLYPMEDATQAKEILQAGASVKFFGPAGKFFTMQLDSEKTSVPLSNIGTPPTPPCEVLMNGSTPNMGNRTIGLTLNTDWPCQIEFTAMDYKLRNRWGTP